jgi:thiol:disulfide interchange protein
MPLPIRYEIKNIADFNTLLQTNPGVLIIKLGAKWCKPCNVIDPHVIDAFKQMPDTVQGVLVDIDISKEIHTYLKSKLRFHGIPVVLVYYKENISYIPDDSVIGCDITQLALLFKRCYVEATSKL